MTLFADSSHHCRPLARHSGLRALFTALLLSLLSLPVCASNVAANKAVARRVIAEILSGGNFDLASQLYAPSFVNHGLTRDVGLDVDQAAARGWKVAFPDLVMTPEIVAAEGDLVTVLWRARGTNTGAANGIPATGKRGSLRGITLWRIAGGRVQEEWSDFSTTEMLRQLGLVPGGPARPLEIPVTAEVQPAAVSHRVAERNRKVATSAFADIVGKGRLDLFDTLYDPAFVAYLANGGTSGVGEARAAVLRARQAAPDLALEVTKCVVDGDLVAVMYTARGTQATGGRPFAIRGLTLLRVRNGKITDEWNVVDPAQAIAESVQ